MPLEDAPSFDFSTLTQKILNEVQAEEPGISRKDAALVAQGRLVDFHLDGQNFSFIVKRAGKDTTKIYVFCPECGRPCQILYKPDMDYRQPRYLCRSCHRLKYRSQLYQHTEKYQELLKPMRRLAAVKKMLLNPRIKSDTAERLLKEYEVLSERLKANPQYRILKFRIESAHTDNLLLGEPIDGRFIYGGQGGKGNRSLQEEDDPKAQTPVTDGAPEGKTLLSHAQGEDQDAAKTLHQEKQDLHEDSETVQKNKTQLVIAQKAPCPETETFSSTLGGNEKTKKRVPKKT